MNQEESTKIHIDNKSTQILAKNLVFYERSKHRYKKEVELVHVKTQDQVADILTKPLKFEDFRRLRTRLGIHIRTLWEKIESLYASKCGNNKLFLLNSIVSLKFKEDTSVLDHLNEFQGIIDQMSEMDIKFEDEIFVVSLQMVKGSVLNEEMRRKAQGSPSQFEALVTENWGRSQKKEREKSRSKSKSRYKNVKCHYCHKTGHIQKHCFLWKKENKGKKGKSKEKDDDDDDDRVTTATGDDLVILRDFESINFISDESMWIIDSGVTLHVTPRKEFFTSYT
ncbi:hypothetical protein CR513_30721, partial [Mucuna pruriens]